MMDPSALENEATMMADIIVDGGDNGNGASVDTAHQVDEAKEPSNYFDNGDGNDNAALPSSSSSPKQDVEEENVMIDNDDTKITTASEGINGNNEEPLSKTKAKGLEHEQDGGGDGDWSSTARKAGYRRQQLQQEQKQQGHHSIKPAVGGIGNILGGSIGKLGGSSSLNNNKKQKQERSAGSNTGSSSSASATSSFTTRRASTPSGSSGSSGSRRMSMNGANNNNPSTNGVVSELAATTATVDDESLDANSKPRQQEDLDLPVHPKGQILQQHVNNATSTTFHNSDMDISNANTTTEVVLHPSNTQTSSKLQPPQKNKSNNTNKQQASAAIKVSIKLRSDLLGDAATTLWKSLRKNVTHRKQMRSIRKIKREMERVVKNGNERREGRNRELLLEEKLAQQQQLQAQGQLQKGQLSSEGGRMGTGALGSIDRMMMRISQVGGGSSSSSSSNAGGGGGGDTWEDWRKEWRGIHLPPSMFHPPQKERVKKKKKEKDVLEIASGSNNGGGGEGVIKLSKETQGGAMPPASAQDGSTLGAQDTAAVGNGQHAEVGNNHDIPYEKTLPISTTHSNFLHPSTYASQPSIPLYPLLFFLLVFYFLKKILFGSGSGSGGRILSYKQRTRMARGLLWRIPCYGGNPREFVVSQEELEAQISKLKSKGKKKKRKSKGEEDQEKDGSNGDKDHDEDGGDHNGKGGSDRGGSNKENNDSNDDSNDKSENKSDSNSDSSKSNNIDSGTQQGQSNNNQNKSLNYNQFSYLNWMKLHAQLEQAEQRIEELSTDVVCANERSEMLEESLTKVKNEKEALMVIKMNKQERPPPEQEVNTPHHNSKEGELERMKLQEQLENACQKIEQLSADLVCAHEQYEMMHEENQSLLDKLETQSDELEHQKERTDDIRIERDALRQELERHTQSSELANQVSKAKDMLRAELERNTMVENEELERANRKVEQLRADLVCAEERYDMVREQLVMVKEELKDHNAEHATFRSLAEAEKMKHGEELECVQQKVEQLDSDLVCAKEREEMLNEKLSEIKTEKDTLATRLQQQTELQETHHQEHIQQMAKLTEENTTLLQKVATLEAENEKMDLEMECLVDKMMCDREGEQKKQHQQLGQAQQQEDQELHEGEDVEFDASNSVGSLQAESLTDDDDDDDDGEEEDSNDGIEANDDKGIRQELSSAKLEIERLTCEHDVATQNYTIELSKLKSQNEELRKKLLRMEREGASLSSLSGGSQDMLTKVTATSTTVAEEVVTDVCLQSTSLSPISTTTMSLATNHDAEREVEQKVMVEINDTLRKACETAKAVVEDLQRGLVGEGNISSSGSSQIGEDVDEDECGKDNQAAATIKAASMHGGAKHHAAALLHQLDLIKELKGKSARLSENTFDHLKEENEKLQAQIDRLAHDMTTSHQKIDTLSNNLSKAHRQLEQDKFVAAILKEENDALRDENNQSVQKINSLLSELSAHQQMECSNKNQDDDHADMMLANQPPKDQELIVGFRQTSCEESSSSFEDFLSNISRSEEGGKSSSELSSAVDDELQQGKTNGSTDCHAKPNGLNDEDAANAIAKTETSSSPAKKSKAVPRLVRLWSSRNDVGKRSKR